MGTDWEIVKLKEVIQSNVDSVDVSSQPEFYFAGVYCFGGGLFEKGLVNGSKTSYKTYNRLHKNQIVISKVKGWEGAIALVTDEFDGMFLSPVYPTFSIISEDNTDISYINYFLKQKDVWQKLLSNSKGIGARRNSISEDTFLNLEIPLPPLAEQKRMVSKIESVQNKIEQIRKLRAEQEREISTLFFSIYENCFNKYPKEKIGKILDRQIRFEKKDATKEYTFSGTYSFGRGIFKSYIKKGNEFNLEKLQRIKKNDFVFCKIMAWEGAFGLVSEECDNTVMSGAFVAYQIKKRIVNPVYLENYFKIEDYWKKIGSKSTGTNMRRKTLSAEDFENYEIPLPPIEEQNRIVAFLEKVNQLQLAYKTQEMELSELLPALLDKAFKGKLLEEEKPTTITTARSYELEAQYFPKRKALGAYIINQSLNDDKFGDTKFEKLMHLAEYWAIKRNFNQQYLKQTAGPYDNRFTFEFYNQVQKAKWFIFRKSKNEQTRIIAGINHSKSQNYYGYFSENEFAKVNELICYFNKCDYKEPEIVSTLYAVWNNRIIRQQEISDKLLVQDFYDWDKHKKVYLQDKVQRGLNWMREKDIVPDGWGEVIERVKSK
ncbi:MAG: restriction endonuclease subunit S [Mediterranea sp.]|jgi:restriction endonuclease S subunit|nr:restriction endonuclease subunit S [Mediterranea sp.]